MEIGAVGEFGDAGALIRAVRALVRRGYRDLDAFTPYPVKGLEDALALPRSDVPFRVLPFAILGAVAGYLVQYLCNAVDYPLNVGGRPLHAAPAFVPITFETMVLSSAIFGLVIGLCRMGLPRLYRPVFEVAGFERATVDRFFLGVGTADPLFSAEKAEIDLREAGALRIVITRAAQP